MRLAQLLNAEELPNKNISRSGGWNGRGWLYRTVAPKQVPARRLQTQTR